MTLSHSHRVTRRRPIRLQTGTLRHVLVHRPGRELAEHDSLTATLRQSGDQRRGEGSRVEVGEALDQTRQLAAVPDWPGRGRSPQRRPVWTAPVGRSVMATISTRLPNQRARAKDTLSP
jgi:hypothetical protein